MDTRSSTTTGSCVGVGSWLAVLPSGKGTARCQREGQQGTLGKGLGDQSDAERHAVGTKAEGECEAAQAEEIHEVGVVAEMRIVEHGFALEIGQAIHRPGGRQGQEIEALHRRRRARF